MEGFEIEECFGRTVRALVAERVSLVAEGIVPWRARLRLEAYLNVVAALVNRLPAPAGISHDARALVSLVDRARALVPALANRGGGTGREARLLRMLTRMVEMWLIPQAARALSVEDWAYVCERMGRLEHLVAASSEGAREQTLDRCGCPVGVGSPH